MTTTWQGLLLDQLGFYWDFHLQPRLKDLSDDEYLWEPVAGAWSLREGEDGVVRAELLSPEPPVPPITTIAWRMAHIGRDVFGKRARAFFGGSAAPDEADMFDDRHWPEPLPLTAAGGLALLNQGYHLWRDAIATLDDDALLRPLGQKGGPFADDSMAALVLHLSRETMAHGAEICLLRDLYRVQVLQGEPMVRAAYAGDDSSVGQGLGHSGGAILARREPSLLADVAALRHWGVVRELVAARFPTTLPGETGATALHYAAAAGERAISELLLDNGADASVVDDSFGLDPAGWAGYFGHEDLAEQLRPEE